MRTFGLTLLTLGIFFSASSALAIQAEYHWTLCETSPAAVKTQLAASVSKSSRRYIYYLDTKQRDLYQAGIILRLRGEAGEPVEVTVKIATQPNLVPDTFKEEAGFKCESDFQGQTAKTHCSLSEETIDPSDLKQFLKGTAGADTLFSKTQIKYLSSLGAKVVWNDLLVVGPLDNLKWKLKSSPVKFDLELMTTSSGSTLLQLSTKEDQASASRFQQITKLLISKGTEPCSKQIGTATWALGRH